MEKTDARKHSPQAQHQIRLQVVRLREEGLCNKAVARRAGISESHASTIWQRYKKEGVESINLRKRGRRKGEQRILSVDQEADVQAALIDNTPDQLSLAFALWTREAVKLLIKERYGIEMPIRTVGEYLKRWGLTPRKPITARHQNSQAIKQWLVNDYRVIALRAREENAEIHWGDVAEVQTAAAPFPGFGPEGRPPFAHAARRSRILMLPAFTSRGKVRFMIYRDAMNSELLIKFLTRLITDTGRKVFLILDKILIHHRKEVRKWAEEHRQKIEIFMSPPIRRRSIRTNP